MAGVRELTPTLGATAACHAMGLWRGQLGRDHLRQFRAALVGPPRAGDEKP